MIIDISNPISPDVTSLATPAGSSGAQETAKVLPAGTQVDSLGLRLLDVGGLAMAPTLEALGLLMIGLARNGAGTFDLAVEVDIG